MCIKFLAKIKTQKGKKKYNITVRSCLNIEITVTVVSPGYLLQSITVTVVSPGYLLQSITVTVVSPGYLLQSIFIIVLKSSSTTRGSRFANFSKTFTVEYHLFSYTVTLVILFDVSQNLPILNTLLTSQKKPIKTL